MVLKSVLRSLSASPGGKAATPSNITLSAQALYWASILMVPVSIISESSRWVFMGIIQWGAFAVKRRFLLRPRRKRPSCRATDYCDELAPPHEADPRAKHS